MANNTFTISIKKDDHTRVKEVLIANDWVLEYDSNQYVDSRFRSPRGSICILYLSGKLVFQGSEDFTSVIANIQGDEGRESFKDFKPHLGVDEVGKGDYFGPLVVASCFVDEVFAKKISLLGFADSKKFTDGKILKMFESIKDHPYYYVSVVSPHEYNILSKEYNNASILLAKQHSLVIEKGLVDLKSKGVECSQVVVDQFSSSKSRVSSELGELGKGIELVQFHKGESDIAVAAASIIARAIFLQEWEKMNNEYYFSFPKGATNVVASGKEFVKLHGREELDLVAKTGFRTTQEVLGMF